MLRIAITAPDILPDEPQRIAAVLDSGWDYVHVRHPQASLRQVRRIIDDLHPRYHSRLRLHGHFELVYELNLGGLHLNSRCPEPPALYQGRLSRSCHSVDEAIDAISSGRYDYVTLSPIFPSISKPGYSGHFTADDLKRLPAQGIVALGGVTPERVSEIRRMPFEGYAVLGYLFGQPDLSAMTEHIKQFDNQ